MHLLALLVSIATIAAAAAAAAIEVTTSASAIRDLRKVKFDQYFRTHPLIAATRLSSDRSFLIRTQCNVNFWDKPGRWECGGPEGIGSMLRYLQTDIILSMASGRMLYMYPLFFYDTLLESIAYPKTEYRHFRSRHLDFWNLAYPPAPILTAAYMKKDMCRFTGWQPQQVVELNRQICRLWRRNVQSAERRRDHYSLEAYALKDDQIAVLMDDWRNKTKDASNHKEMMASLGNMFDRERCVNINHYIADKSDEGLVHLLHRRHRHFPSPRLICIAGVNDRPRRRVPTAYTRLCRIGSFALLPRHRFRRSLSAVFGAEREKINTTQPRCQDVTQWGGGRHDEAIGAEQAERCSECWVRTHTHTHTSVCLC